jgi:hypothetical protein
VGYCSPRSRLFLLSASISHHGRVTRDIRSLERPSDACKLPFPPFSTFR